MAKQLLGKEVVAALNERIIAKAEALKANGVTPTLGIVRVGENESDLSYERGATKRCEEIRGVEYTKEQAASKMQPAQVMVMNIVLTAIGVLLGLFVNIRYAKMVEQAEAEN